ncbi:MAG: hydrogenase nickel incorporation protein HypB [Syntrophomonadaceae bacterium]|nr:hydrogenase nickel incorporation protein HypB [Syntrophomonadaceae bacterium]
MQINMETHLLGANELLAKRNRSFFKGRKVLVINLMSSPGSGKTTILERTIETLGGQIRLGVIEGDLYTDQDAKRIEKKGVKVIQINTEGACHLDASMVGTAYSRLPADDLELIIIENVGNLVCPAEFDLGEDFTAVVISTTEGNDKLHKYPLIFRQAKAVLLNKMDLLPYTDFNLDRFREDLAQINPSAMVFMISGRNGEGIENWTQWVFGEVRKKNPL